MLIGFMRMNKMNNSQARDRQYVALIAVGVEPHAPARYGGESSASPRQTLPRGGLRLDGERLLSSAHRKGTLAGAEVTAAGERHA